MFPKIKLLDDPEVSFLALIIAAVMGLVAIINVFALFALCGAIPGLPICGFNGFLWAIFLAAVMVMTCFGGLSQFMARQKKYEQLPMNENEKKTLV